jgi:hypothetical protein
MPISNPYNQQNPFLQSIQTRTGGGRVASQTQRDVKKVGDLAKTQGQAQRIGMQNKLQERAMQRAKAMRNTTEDIEMAKSQAQAQVRDYAETLKKQWGKMMSEMEREKQMIAKDMYGQADATAMQQRFAALGNIAQAGVNAVSSFVAPKIGDRIQEYKNMKGMTLDERIAYESPLGVSSMNQMIASDLPGTSGIGMGLPQRQTDVSDLMNIYNNYNKSPQITQPAASPRIASSEIYDAFNANRDLGAKLRNEYMGTLDSFLNMTTLPNMGASYSAPQTGIIQRSF